MMLRNDDGTYEMGPFDVLGILKDSSTGRFHACLWLEHPFPGVPDPNPDLVRLKSKMHHTGGAETFEEAVEHVKELHTKVKVAETNLWLTPEQVVERDFSQDGFADVMVLNNWLKTLNSRTG